MVLLSERQHCTEEKPEWERRMGWARESTVETDYINALPSCGKQKSKGIQSDAAYGPLIQQIQIGCK